ncbi:MULTISPECIES: helix-turn-helix domain-containing protein [unclassified Isoptericola]|uniref:helix-turn-helix domain-containing protein n=1 Tax=unclassified Isoptericola TaxID=2623355 RepID=UPI00364E42DE
MDTYENDADTLVRALLATVNGERVAAGLTVAELAEKSGVPKRTLDRYLGPGGGDIPNKMLTKVAKALGVTASLLWARAEERAAREESRD